MTDPIDPTQDVDPDGADQAQPADQGQRSKEPCPRCGEHRLAMLGVPDVELSTYQVANETLGIPTEVRLEGEPGIGCLACGAEWPDLRDLRAEQGR